MRGLLLAGFVLALVSIIDLAIGETIRTEEVDSSAILKIKDPQTPAFRGPSVDLPEELVEPKKDHLSDELDTENKLDVKEKEDKKPPLFEKEKDVEQDEELKENNDKEEEKSEKQEEKSEKLVKKDEEPKKDEKQENDEKQIEKRSKKEDSGKQEEPEEPEEPEKKNKGKNKQSKKPETRRREGTRDPTQRGNEREFAQQHRNQEQRGNIYNDFNYFDDEGRFDQQSGEQRFGHQSRERNFDFQDKRGHEFIHSNMREDPFHNQRGEGKHKRGDYSGKTRRGGAQQFDYRGRDANFDFHGEKGYEFGRNIRENSFENVRTGYQEKQKRGDFTENLNYRGDERKFDRRSGGEQRYGHQGKDYRHSYHGENQKSFREDPVEILRTFNEDKRKSDKSRSDFNIRDYHGDNRNFNFHDGKNYESVQRSKREVPFENLKNRDQNKQRCEKDKCKGRETEKWTDGKKFSDNSKNDKGKYQDKENRSRDKSNKKQEDVKRGQSDQANRSRKFDGGNKKQSRDGHRKR